MIKLGREQNFLWGITILQISISWCLIREIKNKSLKQILFITLMSTLPISINLIGQLANEINIKLFEQTGEIFQKSAKALAELGYRISKNEWRQLNSSELFRRSLFGTTVLFSFLVLLWEGIKKIPLTKEKR